jgi:outer membrane protein insertion porin family
MSHWSAAPAGCRWQACLFACLLLGGAAAAPRAQEPAVVDSVAFAGLTTVDPELILESIQVRIGEPAHLYRITRSVRSLYALGLFDQVEVWFVPGPKGEQILRFTFAERSRITGVTFVGHEHFSGEDLKEFADLTVGSVLRRSDLSRARREIEQAYRDDGYAQAQVTPLAGDDPASDGVIVKLEIDEGHRVKLRAVNFTGNEFFTDDDLRGKVKVKPQGFLRKGRFQREKLEEDVLRLEEHYHNHGFRDARASLEEPVFSPDGVYVDVFFGVEEGPRYYFGRPGWQGASVFDERAFRTVLQFQPGVPYDQSRVDDSLAELYNMYTERGYLVELRIEPVSVVKGDSVEVTFHVTEGNPSRVGDIHITGNTRTKEHVIRRELKLFPGDVLRRSRLLRSQRDIFATGFFEDAAVEFNPSERPGEVDVTFRVKEKSAAQANGGVGYSSQMGLTGFVKFGHNNLFGNGQAVAIEIERGRRREFYDLSLTEPWAFGRPIAAGIDLYNTENYREVSSSTVLNSTDPFGGTEVGTITTTDPHYWHSTRGIGLRLGFPWILSFPDYTRMSTGYSISETRYRDYGSLPLESQVQVLDGAGSRSRVYVSLHRNSTDNPFHASLGTRTTMRVELNGGFLGGDMDYYRFTIDHRQYFQPFWRPVLMLRYRLGAMDTYSRSGRMPSGELFRLGGVTGFDLLRGYDDYYVVPEENITRDIYGRVYRFPGGNVMFGFTSEFQFPVVDPVWGALFIDAGDTWTNGYDISLNGLKLGVGAGVTMEVPMLGPIGLYYAYGTETGRWRTHFAFGPSF